MMRIDQFINNLPPLHFEFYAALSKIDSPLHCAYDYRILWTESGSIDDDTMDIVVADLESSGIPSWILAALEYDELHKLLLGYSLIVHEKIVEVVNG